MAPQDIQMITDRLDRQDQKLETVREDVLEIRTSITRQCAICEGARAEFVRLRNSVDGNGKPSLDHRVTVLETTKTVGKWFIATAIGLGAFAAAAAQAVAQWLIRTS